jgi:hypothetical protein
MRCKVEFNPQPLLSLADKIGAHIVPRRNRRRGKDRRNQKCCEGIKYKVISSLDYIYVYFPLLVGLNTEFNQVEILNIVLKF